MVLTLVGNARQPLTQAQVTAVRAAAGATAPVRELGPDAVEFAVEVRPADASDLEQRAVGALAGAPILGHYTGHRAGHSMTNMLLHALFNTPGALRLVEVDGADAARLPGVGVVPQDMPAVA